MLSQCAAPSGVSNFSSHSFFMFVKMPGKKKHLNIATYAMACVILVEWLRLFRNAYLNALLLVAFISLLTVETQTPFSIAQPREN